MAKAINIETEIAKILTKYGDEVAENIQKVTKEIARKGAKAVKQNSQNSFGGTGKYAAGWTSQAKEGRYSAQGVIYTVPDRAFAGTWTRKTRRRSHGRQGAHRSGRAGSDQVI